MRGRHGYCSQSKGRQVDVKSVERTGYGTHCNGGYGRVLLIALLPDLLTRQPSVKAIDDALANAREFPDILADKRYGLAEFRVLGMRRKFVIDDPEIVPDDMPLLNVQAQRCHLRLRQLIERVEVKLPETTGGGSHSLIGPYA
jgi:hypothetical protein